jgi:hypothetical protein
MPEEQSPRVSHPVAAAGLEHVSRIGATVEHPDARAALERITS